MEFSGRIGFAGELEYFTHLTIEARGSAKFPEFLDNTFWLLSV